MAIPQSKNQYENRSIANFETLEQTCRLRQLSGSGGKYVFQLAESIKATVYSYTKFSTAVAAMRSARMLAAAVTVRLRIN